jgi:O-antigen/teichoic acid export membrane protein
MASKSTSIHFGEAIEDDALRQTVVSSAVSLTVADMVVQVINYGIQIGLARYLTPAKYGYFGIIVSILILLEVVLRWGLPQAISYFVAQDRDTAQDTLRKSVGLQAIFGLLCFLVFLWFANNLALVLGDAKLSDYLYACAPFILTFALVPAYAGFLNGLGAFTHLAALRAVSHLVKLLLVVVLLYAGAGIYGVIAAYTVSPLVIIAYGSFLVRSRSWPTRKSVGAKHIFRFGFPVFIAVLAVSLLMRIDLFMVQSILGDEIRTGLYTAASSLMRGPYFLSLGTAAVFFRMTAQLRAESLSKVREFVSRVARYYLLGLAPIPFILYATAEETIRMVFGDNYVMAVPTFKVLSFCFAFMVLYNVVTTFILALARPQFAMILALVLIPVQVLLIYIGIFTHELVGVALATTLTWGLGTLVGIFYLVREGCLSLPRWKTVLKITIASIFSYSVALWILPHGLWLLILYPCVYFIYVAFLRLTGEIGSEEIRLLYLAFSPAKRIFART